ncbi:DNA-directed RNA polymerase III RPC8 [Babesia caballi]|uniref:DNA-directed RNA polymerase III RPC8 n=1 Tax=Babesia caballi TaxID=5871 RepID=A0AAV4M065_BABCB|nr:DNA-directed RNA polymerase III RPC8 [Babesia caballi]
MEAMVRQLTERYRVHTIVVKAQSHNMSLIDVERSAFPPDIVISAGEGGRDCGSSSAGGDGTFLEAAALVPPTQPPRKQLWIVGLNTDPERSVGALCLSYFKRGDTVFRRYTAAAGEGASGGPGLPPKQNMIRFTGPGPESLVRKECTSDTTGAREWDAIVNASFNEAPAGACRDAPDQCTVISKNTANIYNLTYDEYVGHLLERLIVRRDCEPVARQKIRIKMCKRHGGMEREIANVKVDSTHIEDTLFCGADSDFSGEELETEIRSSRCGLVPCSAVNDVIVADESFGRTFYGLMQVDSSPVMRVKSSGVLVSTGERPLGSASTPAGTGSTAWAYNMCKQTMHNGFMLFNSLLSHPSLPREVADRVDAKMMREAIEAHNASLVFAASENTMKCIIREAISTT